MKTKILKAVLTFFGCLFLFVGFLAFFASTWYIDTYGNVGFDSVLFTLFSDSDGTEVDIIKSFLLKGLLPAVLSSALTGFILFFEPNRTLSLNLKNEKKLRIYPLHKALSLLLAIFITLPLLAVSAKKVELTDYVESISTESSIYDEKYVDPSKAEIIFPEEKQNLIYIYLESMETSFFTKELGGGNDLNPIPELYDLAKNNLNFSHNDSVGGFRSLSGGTWTIAALVSQTSGIPLKTPVGVGENDYGTDTFLPGVTSINDILAKNGYNQAFMCGSDVKFGGREAYFTQHGVNNIFDLATAWNEGIVEDGRKVWWGMEDFHLFDYAKEKITKMASEDSPFAFTMLTVDTHFADGYVCERCVRKYDEQYENVLACSSKQVDEFVKWIEEQDFFENTTVIICGDHPTMDNHYIQRKISPDAGRFVYNCIINSKTTTFNTKNRNFSSLDMFPTTLAAMGCIIKGDRLGLGTNLFSDTPTLLEELGTEEFNNELKKSSEFYNLNFFLEEETGLV